jgi:adenylate cyclase class 2
VTSPTPSASAPGSRDEIEIKLPAPDLDAVRARLRDRGAALKAAEHDEVNDLYDDRERRLSASGRALRIRRSGDRAILTYKGPARFQAGTKIREEREAGVSDAAELAAILERLGYERRFRYEKRREEWSLEGCVIALDTTPIGTFVEVEGYPVAIRHVLAQLELDASEAIPYSYAELYARRRKEQPSLPLDMVWGTEQA